MAQPPPQPPTLLAFFHLPSAIASQTPAEAVVRTLILYARASAGAVPPEQLRLVIASSPDGH
jgi:hypothetical protein